MTLCAQVLCAMTVRLLKNTVSKLDVETAASVQLVPTRILMKTAAYSVLQVMRINTLIFVKVPVTPILFLFDIKNIMTLKHVFGTIAVFFPFSNFV